MGGFWDILEDGNVRGKCETNYFHIYVNSEIKSTDISELDNVTKGTFMHEYLHYLQFISTVFGLSYGTVYNNYFSYCRKHFSENESINIPLNILSEYPELNKLLAKYKHLKGSASNLAIDIGSIEVSDDEVYNAKANKKAVNIKVFESGSNVVHTFSFGYLSIIESMAHIFQSFFDPTIEHPQIPYNAVQLICKYHSPSIYKDKKMMFSICLCSLMFNNPGAGFFEILKVVRINPRLDGQSLYKHMLKESTVTNNGVQKSLSTLFMELIDNYQLNIESAIDNQLTYFAEVFNNCKIECDSGESLLLKVLYESDITSKESIDKLLNFYGLPLVDSSSATLMAKLPTNDSKYIDIACLRSLEMVIKRFNPTMNIGNHPKYDPKCSMFDKCFKSQYAYEDNPPFEMSNDCKNKQWLKDGVCIMTESLRYYKLMDKQINQKELPTEMQ